MKKSLLFIIAICTILGIKTSRAQEENTSDFIPKGYVLFETIYGDFNKDGKEDCVLIIKGTDKKNKVINSFGQQVDRNRRGVIVLLNNNDSYEIAIKNYSCFSSENEEGGVYFPPELSLKIDRGNLYIHYAHGRYGYWKYTFRYQNEDFALIGYDSSDNHGPRVNSITSINYLTKKKLVSENISSYSENDEVFEDTWENIETTGLVKLSEIEDFEML